MLASQSSPKLFSLLDLGFNRQKDRAVKDPMHSGTRRSQRPVTRTWHGAGMVATGIRFLAKIRFGCFGA
jgi:hypothetical protein